MILSGRVPGYRLWWLLTANSYLSCAPAKGRHSAKHFSLAGYPPTPHEVGILGLRGSAACPGCTASEEAGLAPYLKPLRF